jgi:hypothetical protein
MVMAMYAIKDTTLTALGDAVRSNVVGIAEIPYYTTTVALSSTAAMFGYQSDFVSNLKVKLNMNYTTTSGNPLYIAKGIYADALKARNSTSKVAINSTGNTISGEYETIIEGGSFTIVSQYGGTSLPYPTIDIEVIPVDENGNEYKYTPLEMVEIINGLMTLPNEALNITGDCAYRFAYGSNNWLINRYGDKVKTYNISNAGYMFNNNKTIKYIPFEINLNNNATIERMFDFCQQLKEIPQVNITTTSHISLQYLLEYCHYMSEIPEWLIDLLEEQYNLTATNNQFGKWNSMFNSCYSLRQIPERAMRAINNPKPSSNYYGVAYCKPFVSCHSLDELLNIACDNCALTSNQFSGFFSGLSRVKNITFETNEDGTPLVRQWKSQTIELNSPIGYSSTPSYITGYNSGITADKEVKDDATYQALKNDPDWFSANINYSRYNHDSAVNTINSLPDCSATGTNTIKFRGATGAKTDGGAINTLTEAEIAVATAKGWTVSLT